MHIEITINHTKEHVYTAEVNYLENRNVFRLDLKDGRGLVSGEATGREFQLEGPVNEKARWPAVVTDARDPESEKVSGRAEPTALFVSVDI